MNKKTIKDVDVAGKRCFVRCDFNVPLDENLNITDETRIQGALPTIKYLMEKGAKVILSSHLGRPKGEFNMKYSLAPVAKRLNELLAGKVAFASDVIGEDAKAKVAALKPGEAVLLENVRFHKEEDSKDEAAKEGFAKELAKYADVYVNDAFGTAHRAHASTATIAKFVPVAVAGFLIGKELDVMGGALENPARPFVAILGGAKVADKLNVISNLLTKCDTLVIGGGMAYTFLSAMGGKVGTSLVDTEKLGYCKEMLEKANKLGKTILLPIDSAIVANFPSPIDVPVDVSFVESKKIPDDMMGLDIGPKTIELYTKAIANAKTVVWNGPMGVFENPTFAKGTIAIAKALAESNAITIIGGGDSAAAVTQMGYANKMTHISTGGGASLEFLEGLVLPGVDCLNNK